MGFSEHIPLLLSNGEQSDYRVRVEEAEAYCNEVREASEKYRDYIDIKLGFEMEYYPECFDQMLEFARRCGAEYLILGQHFTKPEDNPSSVYVAVDNSSRELLKEHTDLTVEAMKTGYFSYVAHPDIFNFWGDEAFYEGEMRRICIASRETGIPLEINFLGIRCERHYPNETFWRIAGEEMSPVTFGFDAHSPIDAYDEDSLERALEMVERYKLNYIGKPEINDIQPKKRG